MPRFWRPRRQPANRLPKLQPDGRNPTERSWRRIAWRLLLAAAAVPTLLLATDTLLQAREPPTSLSLATAPKARLPDFYLHVSAAARAAAGGDHAEVPVVVALHGMGGNGRQFSRSLLAAAERYGWVLVAPTFAYGDWRDPNAVVADDLRFSAELTRLLDALPWRTNRVPILRRVYLFGFSRGAQIAHRYALFHPERVAGVVAISAGTYTLPTPIQASRRALFPYGTSDLDLHVGHGLNLPALRRIPFLVGVGEADANPSDLPRQWDQYEGSTRVARATAFVQALKALDVSARLHVFPAAGHGLRGDMIDAAVQFLVDPTGNIGKGTSAT